MRNVYHALLLPIAGWTHKELARTIRYLKTENEIMRSKLPYRVPLTPQEKSRLVKFGEKLGKGRNELVSIVHPDTLRRWIREKRNGKQPSAGVGRPRTNEEIRQLIIMLGRENGWGYTRILGELRKVGIRSISRNTVKNILIEHGLDPGPKRGAGTWDEFLKIHADSLWQCDCAPWKGGSFQRVEFPPGNWSLQPVAIGAAVEATKPSKPSMQRVAWRSREHAGRNVSEHRASLENHNAEADPPVAWGRRRRWNTQSDTVSAVPPGQG